MLLSENRITEGKLELEKLITYDNNNIHALNLLALCEFRYCNFNTAIKYIDKSIKLKDIKTTRLYREEIYSGYKNGLYRDYYLIVNNLKKKQYYKQIDKLENIKANNTQLIEPYLLLAILYLRENKLIRARKNISLAYKMDISNPLINKLYLKLKI